MIDIDNVLKKKIIELVRSESQTIAKIVRMVSADARSADTTRQAIRQLVDANILKIDREWKLAVVLKTI